MELPFYETFMLYFPFFKVGVLLVVGLPALFFISRVLASRLQKRFSDHGVQLVKKVVVYGGIIVLGMSALHELGFQLSVLLGAAGVIGVALGFASQTSVSNIISGLFLLMEQSFVVGDRIECGSFAGIVQSIDLLSIKLRTANNQLIRIPNEIILKQGITNHTYYAVVRTIIVLSVARENDVHKIYDLVRACIQKNAYVLKKPEPILFVRCVTDRTYQIELRLWSKKEDLLSLRSTFVKALYDVLKQNEVVFPPERDYMESSLIEVRS